MAYLDIDEYIPVWLPHWLPDEVLEEIYLGLLAASQDFRQVLPEESEPDNGYINRDWFGPFLLGPPSRFLRGSC